MSTSILLHGSGVEREAHVAGLVHAPVRRQWLDVDGFITDRLLVTYRAPAERLRALVPAPFVVDTVDGFGFLSVCALEVVGMGISRSPRWLRFDNRELLYRVGVRYQNRPTFLTLRSDTSSRALALLGGSFSHYAPHHARIVLSREHGRFELRCEARDAEAHAHLVADLQPVQAAPPGSLFADAARAAEFLIGMSFSAAIHRERVLLQPILHDPWEPRFVVTEQARFDYLAALERRTGMRLSFDNALHVRAVHQTWTAARWQK